MEGSKNTEQWSGEGQPPFSDNLCTPAQVAFVPNTITEKRITTCIPAFIFRAEDSGIPFQLPDRVASAVPPLSLIIRSQSPATCPLRNARRLITNQKRPTSQRIFLCLTHRRLVTLSRPAPFPRPLHALQGTVFPGQKSLHGAPQHSIPS